MKGPQPLHYEIRSSDMRGIRAERAQRAKQRSGDRDSKGAFTRLLGSPGSRSGCKPLLISFSGRAQSAQENDVIAAASMRQQTCSERPSTIFCRRSRDTHSGVLFLCHESIGGRTWPKACRRQWCRRKYPDTPLNLSFVCGADHQYSLLGALKMCGVEGRESFLAKNMEKARIPIKETMLRTPPNQTMLSSV